MTQGASSDDLSEVQRQRLADEQMHVKMQVHRHIIQVIQVKLEPMNLINITNVEVRDYQIQVNDAIKYITSTDNALTIHQFVRTVGRFEEIGSAIIIDFNNALRLWDWFHASGRSVAQYGDGEREYEKRLNECRTKFDELLAELKDF